VFAHGDRHGGKLGAGGAVNMHVALHGDGGAARRRGEPVGRGFAVGAALFAGALDVARAAEKAALAGETHGGDAGDDAGEAGGDSERRVLERVGDETPVQPRLVDVADVEPERLGDAVVVGPERPAEMDREAVDVAALQARVGERGFERNRRELELALGQPAPEAARADADDGGVKSHGGTSLSLPKVE